jgi:hypothetical protein
LININYWPEEVLILSVTLAILLVLGAGLFVGGRVQNARTAHALFTSYRSRAAKSFAAWVRSTVVAILSVVGMLVLLFILQFLLHRR